MDVFNARLISALSSDRLYRVFFDQGEVFFIQIGGQDYGPIIASQFGMLSGLIYPLLQRRSQAKLDAKIEALGTQPPSAHLAAGKNNFSAIVADIESSTLQPAGGFAGHGPHLGRWVLQLRGQKPMTLQLETAEDMWRALELLPQAIGNHENNVVWDSARNAFVKTA